MARSGNLFHERLDIRAQEFGRPVARRADQMKVPRMPVRGLISGTTFAEVDLARDSGADHPLKRSVYRGAAYSGRFAMDQRHELVSGDVAFLPQEHTEDAIPLCGAFAADRTRWGRERHEIGKWVNG